MVESRVHRFLVRKLLALNCALDSVRQAVNSRMMRWIHPNMTKIVDADVEPQIKQKVLEMPPLSWICCYQKPVHVQSSNAVQIASTVKQNIEDESTLDQLFSVARSLCYALHVRRSALLETLNR